MRSLFILIIVLSCFQLEAQLYFPPNHTSEWETLSPETLDWCPSQIDDLYSFLDTKNTKAFILLKDGKIVLEQYFDDHTASTNWYWASAGKTLTAFMVGIAQQQNHLNINNPTSNYLGEGWSDVTASKEDDITVWHQLTMTTGLDDGVEDQTCTTSDCLRYLTDAGTRWAYHNAPYTLLDQVIENATGQSLNLYTTQQLKNPIGMNGIYAQLENNTVFFSTARSMARFGLLILNQGNWNGNQVLADHNYFEDMVNTSQNLNPSYGYLWWLNGKTSFMIPQSQLVFNGSLFPNAPEDMISALGKNGQFINVVPSRNLVWIRMGEAPDNTVVPFSLNDEIWEYVNALPCSTLHASAVQNQNISIYPNPTEDFVFINSPKQIPWTSYEIYNSIGRQILKHEFNTKIDVSFLSSGLYYLKIKSYQDITQTLKFIKK